MHAVMGVVLERESRELAAPHFQSLEKGPLAATPIGKLGSRARARPVSGKAGKREEK